ncbi:MAG: hypothetical protein LUQ38_10865 [Methanotrichaceae archaeon]|nr:hypothetical protein [Methanotrichaceae archaeon]
MRKVISIALLILILISLGSARMPQKGDVVKIMVPNGSAPLAYAGTITDIGNGFICMNCVYAKAANLSTISEPTDLCIGIGQIAELFWAK